MMAKWDFRSILNIYPDKAGFTCVGTTKKNARCGNSMFSHSDTARAAVLLDEINSCSKLSSSYKYLEELAELTLCPRWHRDKPGHAQVRQTCMRWRAEIAAFDAEMEREKKKAAMIKSKRALAELRKHADDIKVKLEEERVPNRGSVTSPQASDEAETALPKMWRLSGPEPGAKVLSALSIPKPSLAYMTPPSVLNNTPSRNLQQSVHEKSTSTNTKSSKPQSNNHRLPSPPDTPMESKALRSAGVKQEQSPPTSIKASHETSPRQQHFTIMENSSIEVTANAKSNDTIPKIFSREETKIQAISFGFPPTPDATPQPRDGHPTGTADAPSPEHELEAQKQVIFPGIDVAVAENPNIFNFTTSNSPSTDSIKAMSVFNFNPQYNTPSKSFDFETPSKLPFAMRLLEKSSSVCDDFNTRAEKEFGKECGREEDEPPQPRQERNQQSKTHLLPRPKLSIMPPTCLETETEDPFLSAPQPQTAQDPPKPLVKKASLRARFGIPTPEATPEPSQRSNKLQGELYGYAIITSTTTTKYKTYVPSAHRHSTMIPSATPETRRKGVQLQDPFWAFTSTPSPHVAVLRKPLPLLPPSEAEVEKETCEACGVGRSECRCGADSGGEGEDERVGCFHSLRLRRLKKMVVRGVNAVTAKVSGLRDRGSDIPGSS